MFSGTKPHTTTISLTFGKPDHILWRKIFSGLRSDVFQLLRPNSLWFTGFCRGEDTEDIDGEKLKRKKLKVTEQDKRNS